MRLKVLCTGSRTWRKQDSVIIEAWLKKLPIYTKIIHGGAKGADGIVDYYARQLNFEVAVYSQDWNKYGKSAGLVRNIYMFEKEQPSITIAFLNQYLRSTGTIHMINYALEHKNKVFLVNYEGILMAMNEFIAFCDNPINRR